MSGARHPQEDAFGTPPAGVKRRLHFHIRQGDLLQSDPEGRDLPAGEVLLDEAIEAARDLLAEGDLQGLDRRGWVFEVADETGATVLVMPFTDAIEPDLPSSEGRS
jgi:hypothetical protein